MGWHNTFWLTSRYEVKGKVGSLTFIEMTDPKESEFWSEDTNIAGGRHPFWEALFDRKSVVKTKTPEDPSYKSTGYIQKSSVAIAYFVKFALAKKNPFSGVPFFKECVREFMKRIKSGIRGNYVFYPLGDTLVASQQVSDREEISLVVGSPTFYESIRKGSLPSSMSIKLALKYMTYEFDKRTGLVGLDKDTREYHEEYFKDPEKAPARAKRDLKDDVMANMMGHYK